MMTKKLSRGRSDQLAARGVFLIAGAAMLLVLPACMLREPQAARATRLDISQVPGRMSAAESLEPVRPFPVVQPMGEQAAMEQAREQATRNMAPGEVAGGSAAPLISRPPAPGVQNPPLPPAAPVTRVPLPTLTSAALSVEDRAQKRD